MKTDMKDVHTDCKWKTADDGPPENPLQALVMAICLSSKDFAEHKYDAYLYGVIVGWDEDSYKVLKGQHGWSDEQINYQIKLHQNYIKAWNLLTENGIK